MVRRSTSGSSVDLENVFLNGRVDVRLLFKEDFCKLTFSYHGSAWWISDRPRPSEGEKQSILNNVLSETIMPRPKSFPARLMAHPLWLSLSADIFTGQMIASLIVLTFIAVFLLREWISQNARPGVFEDEEALPDEPPAIEPPNPPPVPEAPVQQDQVAAQPQPQTPNLVPLPQHQLDVTQPVNAPQLEQVGSTDIDLDRWFTPPTPPTQHKSRKKKSRARDSDTDDDRMESEDDTSPQQRGLSKRKMFHRRIRVARTTAARRRSFTPLQKSSTTLAVPEQKAKFKFTFKAPSAPLTPDESYYLPNFNLPSGPSDANDDSPSSPFPSVALHPPTVDIPFSLRRWHETTPNGSGSSVSLSYPPRPTLPTATRSLPSSGSNSPFLFSPGRTSTDSPSLVTYRPPEELQAEAGPSDPSGHLGQRRDYLNDEVDQDFEASGKESEEEEYTYRSLGLEHGRYFRDPDDTGSDEEEVEEGPDRLSIQEFLDKDFEQDVKEGEDVNDQARRLDGPADDEEEEEEDDDGIFHEGEDEDEEPDAGEFDQWDENEAAADAIRPQAAPMDAAAGALARAGNEVGEAAPAAAPVADNEEGNAEDDMEGAMEGWSYHCVLL
jgi:E3 ubiquitin-protein ligase MARCH6